MKSFFSVIMFLLVSVSFLQASIVEDFVFDFTDVSIGVLFSGFSYFLYVYAQKYRLGFLADYIDNIVKRVEQEAKTKSHMYIHDKYIELSRDNEKLAYALSLIDDEYSSFFKNIFGRLLGVFDKSVVSVIEAKVYDLKKDK